TSAACSARREMTETISTPSMFFRPSRCFSPNAPAPASAIRMGRLLCRTPPASGRGWEGLWLARRRPTRQALPRSPPRTGGEGRWSGFGESPAAHHLVRFERRAGDVFRLEQERAERRVRGRDVVEGVEVLHLVAERAAHDQP